MARTRMKRRDNPRPRTLPLAYADLFEECAGKPPDRVKKIAQRLGVAETTVRSALRRWWGTRKYRKVFHETTRTFSNRYSPEEYAKKYERLTGDPERRVRIIARAFGVYEQSVRSMLRDWWGIRSYNRRMKSTWRQFPLDREQLLTMLNEGGLWKSGRVLKTIARRLKVPETSLRNKMSRWRKIRGPYLIDD